MKTSNSICIALFIFSKIVCGAHGEHYRTDINPALLYYQAFLLAPKDEDLQYLSTNDWWKGWWRGERLNDEFGSGVSNTAAELELSRQAAHQTVACDWGIDLSRGPRTLLPQLARAKRTVIDSQYQIVWDLQIGNQPGAREDLLTDLALGRNVSQDRTLISVLVEMAIESFACNEIAENFHRFSPETLQQLANGFDAAPPRGTVAECVSAEQPIRDWYLKNIQNLKEQYPDDAGAIGGLHHLLDYYSPEDWEQLTNAAGGTVDGVAHEIRDAEPLYAKLGDIMALPYSEYEGQLKYDSQPALLKAQFEKSGNPFFLRFVSNWQHSRHREFRREVDLAMVRAAIEYKLHGDAGLETVADPCGDRPFTFQRFVLNGVDRGFELKSKFLQAKNVQETYIFVESDGPPFNVTGIKVGQSVPE